MTEQTQPTPPLAVDVIEAARMLDCSESTIRRLDHRGLLESFRLADGGRRYTVASLERYIADQVEAGR